MHNQPARCSLHTEHIFTPPECNFGRSAWRLPLHTQITHWLVRVRARVCVCVCALVSESHLRCKQSKHSSPCLPRTGSERFSHVMRFFFFFHTRIFFLFFSPLNHFKSQVSVFSQQRSDKKENAPSPQSITAGPV